MCQDFLARKMRQDRRREGYGGRRINELTTRWAARVLNGASTVFSGAAVWPLLAYLAAAADGAARRELAEAVGLDGDEAATTARAFLREFAQSPAVQGFKGFARQIAATGGKVSNSRAAQIS